LLVSLFTGFFNNTQKWDVLTRVSRGKPEYVNGLNERNGGQYTLIDGEGYVWVQYSVKWIKMVPGIRPAPPRNMNAYPTENEIIAMRPL